MTDDQQKPAADDVAADMERRLEQLGENVHDAEKRAAAIPENPLSGIAGDPEAVREGPLSGGATPAATDDAHDRDDT